MSKVIFKKASYEYEIIKPLVFDMMDFFAGKDITPGSRVLIKPNFLIPAKPQQAILTHPLIVKAAAEYVLDKKGRIQICDSPAVGSVKKILKVGGYDKILANLDIASPKPYRMIKAGFFLITMLAFDVIVVSRSVRMGRFVRLRHCRAG